MRKTGFGGKGLGEVIGMRGLLLVAALAGGALSADAARENGTPAMQARLLPGLTAALKSLG